MLEKQQEMSQETSSANLTKLFELAQKGNVKAFKQLFESRFQALVEFAEYFGVGHDEAKDIVQECFIAYWEKKKKINPERGIHYLYVSVRNKCMNLLRDKKRIIVNDFIVELWDDEQVDIESNEQSNRMKWLENEINKLPLRCRRIFKLHKFNGLTHKEISKELGISQKTIERQINIAFKKIKKNR